MSDGLTVTEVLRSLDLERVEMWPHPSVGAEDAAGDDAVSAITDAYPDSSHGQHLRGQRADSKPMEAHSCGRLLALLTLGCRCILRRISARVPMVTVPI
jgi:hypothetical protein